MKTILQCIVTFTLLISGYVYANEQDVPVVNESPSVKICDEDTVKLDEAYEDFKKVIQKNISAANSVQWFLGPQKGDLYLKDEKISKMYKDFKQGKSINIQEGACPSEYLISKMQSYRQYSKNSIEAINYTEAKKDSIVTKSNCQDLNKLNCSYPIFKVYLEKLEQLNK